MILWGWTDVRNARPGRPEVAAVPAPVYAAEEGLVGIFTRFNRKNIQGRQIDTLIGLCKGLCR